MIHKLWAIVVIPDRNLAGNRSGNSKTGPRSSKMSSEGFLGRGIVAKDLRGSRGLKNRPPKLKHELRRTYG